MPVVGWASPTGIGCTAWQSPCCDGSVLVAVQRIRPPWFSLRLRIRPPTWPGRLGAVPPLASRRRCRRRRLLLRRRWVFRCTPPSNALFTTGRKSRANRTHATLLRRFLRIAHQARKVHLVQRSRVAKMPTRIVRALPTQLCLHSPCSIRIVPSSRKPARDADRSRSLAETYWSKKRVFGCP